MPDKESRGLKPEELAQDTGRKKVPKTKVATELLILQSKSDFTLSRTPPWVVAPPVNGMVTLGGQTLCSWKELCICRLS